ncbi:helix-turn-helix domain-containing protein [Propionibacteriaceae bacterium Y2011]
MDALVLRISQLDTDAAGALRVIAFYDALMRRRVDPAALVRATANLAECVSAMRLHGTDTVVRYSPVGREVLGAGRPSSDAPVLLDGEEIGTVWLERPGPPRQLDALVLERLALAAAGVAERYGPAGTTMADPALVELAVGPGSDEVARARAMRLLGFTPGRPVTVAAVRSAMSLDQLARLVGDRGPTRAATLGDIGVVLATALDPAGFPGEGVRAGVASTISPEQGWREARTALRFTTTTQPVISYAELGVLALLAEVPGDVAAGNADVVAVARLADDPEALLTLEAYCAAGSVRRAAAVLHLHHSSVARRLVRLGDRLGFELTSPAGAVRAQLALTAGRLVTG